MGTSSLTPKKNQDLAKEFFFLNPPIVMRHVMHQWPMKCQQWPALGFWEYFKIKFKRVPIIKGIWSTSSILQWCCETSDVEFGHLSCDCEDKQDVHEEAKVRLMKRTRIFVTFSIYCLYNPSTINTQVLYFPSTPFGDRVSVGSSDGL